MTTKSERKSRNDNKTTNKKTSNPITMDVKSDMKEPVKGLPRVWIITIILSAAIRKSRLAAFFNA